MDSTERGLGGGGRRVGDVSEGDEIKSALREVVPCGCGHPLHDPYRCTFQYDTGRCDCEGNDALIERIYQRLLLVPSWLWE